jgi:hypothetical protein
MITCSISRSERLVDVLSLSKLELPPPPPTTSLPHLEVLNRGTTHHEAHLDDPGAGAACDRCRSSARRCSSGSEPVPAVGDVETQPVLWPARTGPSESPDGHHVVRCERLQVVHSYVSSPGPYARTTTLTCEGTQRCDTRASRRMDSSRTPSRSTMGEAQRSRSSRTLTTTWR